MTTQSSGRAQHGAAPGPDHDDHLFRQLVEGVVDYAIIGLDPQGVVTSWNPGGERLKGYEAGEIIGQHFSIFYPPEDRAAGVPLRMLDEARLHGRAAHSGWRARKDGSRFWGDIVITALYDDHRTLRGYAKITRDLTERHFAEEALAASEARFRLLVDSVLDYAIIGLDPQGVVTTWNVGAQRLKGYDWDEIVGRHFSVFYTPEDRASGLPIQMLDRARQHHRVEHSGWRVRRDGTQFWGDIVITAMYDQDGVLRGFTKVTRDRTEQHAAQEALEHALGRFAELAHDLRHPLGMIHGYTGLLRDHPLMDDDAVSMLEHVQRNALRMHEMAENILDFSRLTLSDRAITPETLALAPGIRRAAELFDGDATVEIAVPDELTVMVDAVAFERVLVNLLSNASKHSPAGAAVEVSAGAEGAHVAVTVTDRGPGIPPERQATLFEPFGGRAVQGSVGLGLSIVRRYVELHGGEVAVESHEGRGTTVRFTLPAGDDPRRAVAQAS